MKRAGRNARHAALAAHGLQRHAGVDRVVWPIRNPSVAAPPVIRTLAKKKDTIRKSRARCALPAIFGVAEAFGNLALTGGNLSA